MPFTSIAPTSTTTPTATPTRADHGCRSLSECDLGVAQRLALMALRHGGFVRDLPEGSFVGDTAEERAYGDYLLVLLRRYGGADFDEEKVLTVLADHPLLLAPADPEHVTHDCPVCGSPALFTTARGTVCDDCAERVRCSSGHLVAGTSADAWGHFAAYHVDGHGEECHSVTYSGVCWIDDCECVMEETRTGGVVVEVVEAR